MKISALSLQVFAEAALTSLNSSGFRLYEDNPPAGVEKLDVSASSSSSKPATCMGLGVGYRYIKTRSLGFDAGGQFFQESNKLSGSHSVFYQIMGNLNYTFIPHIYGYLGPNVSYIDLKTTDGSDHVSFSTSPDIGGQIGAGYVSNGFSIKIGFQHIQYKFKLDTTHTQTESRSYRMEGGFNGAITQIGYVF